MLGSAATSTSIALILMAIGCLMIIPKIGKAIESALEGRFFDYGQAISEPIKTGGSMLGQAIEGQGRDAITKQVKWGGKLKALGDVIQTISRSH